MTTVKKIATNTSSIFFGNIFVKILALFLSVYLARYLGAEYFGEYNFVLTYLSLFVFVANFGLDPILIRDLSRNASEADRIASNIFIIRLLTSLFSIALSIFFVKALGYSEETISYVSTLSIILLLQGISYLFESVFNANLKMSYSAIGLVASKSLYTIFVFVLISQDRGLIDILHAYIIAELIRTIITMYYSRNFISLMYRVDISLWRSLFKQCLPFIAGYALFIIYYRIDILMLSKMEGNFAVGLYSAAYKLVDPILFIPAALASTLMPLMAKEYMNNTLKFKNLYMRGSKYIFLIMLPVTIVLFFISDGLFKLLYTTEYLPAVITFQILTLTLIFNSMNSIQNSLLIAADRQKVNTVSVGVCCALNLLLNYLLIPIYSYNGAAIATLLSVVALFTLQFLFIKQSLSLVSLDKSIYKIIVSSFLVGIIISTLNMNVLIASGICAILYVFFLYFIKAFTEDDIVMFQSLLKKD
jgi:O-antigen/teichoic acid export membrane protein